MSTTRKENEKRNRGEFRKRENRLLEIERERGGMQYIGRNEMGH